MSRIFFPPFFFNCSYREIMLHGSSHITLKFNHTLFVIYCYLKQHWKVSIHQICLDHNWKWIQSFCPELFTSQWTSTWACLAVWGYEKAGAAKVVRAKTQADQCEVFTQCLVAFFWTWASTNNCLLSETLDSCTDSRTLFVYFIGIMAERDLSQFHLSCFRVVNIFIFQLFSSHKFQFLIVSFVNLSFSFNPIFFFC